MTARLELGLEAGPGGVREAEVRERLTVVVPGLRIALLVLANVIGLLAFTWPFLLPSVAGRVAENHQGDGPWIVAALGAILLALLFLELGRGGLGPKTVALLGVLGAAMVALRLPGFVAGFSALFIVVLVAGNSLGPGFGFLLGCVGMFASGIFVGGLGPWLPFEMVAVGWVGAGAGLLPHGRSWRTRVVWLAAFGFASGYLYGLVMELWFWPFLTDGSALAWDPTGGAWINVFRHQGAGSANPPLQQPARPERPTGELTADKVCQAIAAVLPEGAIVSDESQTSGLTLSAHTAGAPPHDLLTLTGGAIGQGLPVAVGAAVACPDRPGDHVDYLHDGHRHFLRDGLWHHHRSDAG